VIKLKNLLISLLLVVTFGCEEHYIQLGPDPTIYPKTILHMAVGLPEDDNGFYHLTMNRGKWQTIHAIDGLVTDQDTTAYIEGLRVEWESSHYWYIGDTLGYIVNRYLTNEGVYVSVDTSYMVGFNGQEVPTTNQVSISNYDGFVRNMIAPVKSMIGDTMIVSAIYKSDVNWETFERDTIEIPIILD
jgi:hypothetical protein